MKQLTGMDAAFLNIETGPVYGHTSSVAIYDSENAAERLTAARLRERMMSRIHLIPVFRRKLVSVPLDLDQPYWCDDPDFDINAHIYDVGIAAPGSRDQLKELASRIVAKPLDRSRPLWEIAVVNGLEDGQTAVISTVHHSLIDGGSSNDINSVLLDRDPDADQTNPPPQPYNPEPTPDPLSMLTSAMTANALRPLKAAKLQWDVFTELVQKSPNIAKLAPSMTSSAVTGTAHNTVFNAKPTNRRIWEPFRVSLAEVRQIRKSTGATVNDVVMAICAGGLRNWLSANDCLPDKPLTASIPVSIRDDSTKGALGNQVSMIITELPTDVDDPLERLKAVNEAMKSAKEMHDALPMAQMIEFGDFATPGMTSMVARASQRISMAGQVMPSVTISNVPGPQWAMYLCGAKLLENYPVSMIVDGQVLNITLLSYNGSLDFGIVSCPNVVPDLKGVADAIVADHQALLAEATKKK
ncbi:wax ester/triacylglycerol synthase family O-acyltransferase [Gordonia sp. (in: high G+C Gram-positive bacteria)]|jgi:WS/DGAT/MGAT family acyltransferase|uniref:WS/DGAT/MGAT family O-acyltransferase n=1 Tax=Gordonia sp. (in: high G+C Gram-positive bacteria) TaxID=84139 RepID=UPI001D713A38|nr:wax ester/triacylglycerol synthase family O-acyltransferase [Gordonia sp. (in: high G+C Gram-positive bacteria)]MCB1297215.1 wax ester/triacylglycerol synthase family O-acyltransferase [Gordonia sp. (in: high G+C Gram-positive bacteria)]HMS73783.1 wax ester/triacylglycerol synthase family O-acyltransferase [Gordonia sp. (in: high G+C Gram-positive bacteria)]HQV16932.1 wax ester/triacylglycerol synthase family O-acyltransferase [Gordonia sp. (in: high G+C Gram-positive bacteria)]